MIVWKNQFTADDVYTTPARGPGPDYDVGATPVLFHGAGRDLVGVGSKAGIFKAPNAPSTPSGVRAYR